MKLQKVLGFAGVVTLLTGVAWYISYQVKLAKKLVYQFNNLKVNYLSKKRVDFSLNVDIKNETELDVQITGAEIEVYINKVYVTTATSNIEVNVMPNKTTTLPIAFTIDPKYIIENVTDLLFSSPTVSGVTIDIKGKVKVRKFGLPLRIPFEHNMKLSEFI